MNATQKAEIRSLLLAERERIIAEWKEHGGESGPGNDWDLSDPEGRATQITSCAIDRKIAEDDRNLLNKIEFAILRLDDGTYSQCANCGAPIPIERLMAKPSVSLCITCQEAKDAEEL